MGYYLSKRHKQVLEIFIEKIRETNTDFSIELSNPKVLYNILLNSRGYDEYKWIHEKFTLRLAVDRIDFKYIELLPVIPVHNVQVGLDVYSGSTDFFSIVNFLLLEIEKSTVFREVDLTEDEIANLNLLVKEKNFQLTYQDNELIIIKNG